MNTIADICIIPMGVGVSVSDYVVLCERIFEKAGLKTHLHAYGTNVEGPWEAVFSAIKECHDAIHDMGAPRITTDIRVGTRIDKVQTMEDKVSSVRAKMIGQ